MGGPIREVAGIDASALPDSLLSSTEPLVVRGLVSNWPMVRAARESNTAACNYLLRHYKGMPVTVLSTPPQAKGRFFYNEDLSGFNFKRAKGPLDVVLAIWRAPRSTRSSPRSTSATTSVNTSCPAFPRRQRFRLRFARSLREHLLGNRTCIAPHYDLPTNLACVVAGRRRFTLLPPEQSRNSTWGRSSSPRRPGDQPRRCRESGFRAFSRNSPER